jgi:hypothetical protein
MRIERTARRLGSLLAVGLALAVVAALPVRAELPFQHVVIDPSNPGDPHCKTLGDIDGDGLIDALAASSSGDGMFWYEYPTWSKHTIRASGSWTTDMQVGDIDGDDDLDVVIPNGSGLQWYENPRPLGDPAVDTWVEHTISASGADHHDVELGDVEPDGDLDVVTRKKNGNGTFLWRQTNPTTWVQITVSTSSSGEGTALGDVDGDGDLDVGQDGFWVEQVTPTSWTEHTIDASWPQDSGVLIADVDGNGTQDVVLSPSESSSGRFSWYEAIDPKAGPWIEHSIDPTVSYLHTFKAADVDHDGDLDMVTAEMHQSSDPDEVSIYFNNDSGTSWTQQILAETGSHNVRVGDIGGDGDFDVFGANWNDAAPNSAVIEMWENLAAPLPLDSWQRHIVETSLPWRAVFVDGRDLSGDGLPDLVAGGWWYPNPGSLGGTWTRQTIGVPLHNMAAVHDFDRDGDLDVLGTDGQQDGEDFTWARNDGAGTFTNLEITNTATGGDFLQGVSVFQVVAGGQEEVVLSWHDGGSGTATLSIPNDPATTAWPLTVVSAVTNEEEVPVGDIDGDGDVDIHLGDSWLRQGPPGTFTEQSGVTISGGGVPDRVVLADLDVDGDLDVVIGVEFGSALVWGENDGSGGGWTEHSIASEFNYFSVDVGDVDHDGDPDVVGGAHMGSGEVSLYENDGSGLGWTTHVVDSGDSSVIDHHDGTKLVDMDLDGDLDIVSVGWSKQSLVIYENQAIDGGGGGGDTKRPKIASVEALGVATRVEVDFDEPLQASSAGDGANYSISGGVSITEAIPASNQSSVSLTVSALSPGVEYTLTVDNVLDLAGNAISPGSTATFELGAGDPEAGLVAYWPFDEGSGTVAMDVSGNGHNGFLVNGPQWSGQSMLSFDGANDHVDAGNFDVSGGAITLAAWIKAVSLSNCSSNDCRILSKATGTAADDHYFMLSTISEDGATRLRFRLKTDGTTATLIASAGDLPENQWVHAAAVWDGSDMELFLNGVSVGSTSKGGSLTGNPAVPVWIGGNPTEPTSKPWRGEIDEARIYDRALTAQELMALPPPSTDWIFSDGFESGNVSRWDSSVGSTEPLAGAARVGTRGLRVKAGTICTAPDERTIVPPPFTIDGLWDACRLLTAEGVEVVAPGATLRAGEQVGLREGFSASGDLTVEIDPLLTPFAWVRDLSPVEEVSYSVDFHLRLEGLALGASDTLELLVARATASEVVAFRLALQSDGAGGVEARLEARLDDGSFASTPPGEEVALPTGWAWIRLDWQAGAGDGSLSIALDGAPFGGLTGLTNGAQRVGKVDWGTVSGSLDGSSGAIDIDGFRSWR